MLAKAFGTNKLQARDGYSFTAYEQDWAAYSLYDTQVPVQACRAAAEAVLHDAVHAGLGGGKPLQAWKDTKVKPLISVIL